MTRCEEIDSGRDGLVGMSDVVQKEMMSSRSMFVSIAESLMFLTQDRVAYMYSGARDRHVVMMGDQVKPVD